MKQCKNCKHWEDIFNDHPNPIQWGGCDLTLSEGAYVSDVEPTAPQTTAFAFGFFPDMTDCDGDFARLMLVTAPEHSCSMWEEDDRPNSLK